MRIKVIAATMMTMATLLASPVRAECPAAQSGLLFMSCAGDTAASVVLLRDPEIPAASTGKGERRLVITGTYTSGEAREPEGFFLNGGEAYDPYLQGWDGLALIDNNGALSLHHVERVSVDDDNWNLRKKAERRAFLKTAKAQGWSALQSHMLVVDGKVDTKPRDSAPRFRRRVLFSLEDGSYGVYDSPPLTLHAAALDIAERFSPVMALNLDMGSYDFCRLSVGENVEDCGTLAETQVGKLSNLLILNQKVK